jgi:hypothetical protein
MHALGDFNCQDAHTKGQTARENNRAFALTPSTLEGFAGLQISNEEPLRRQNQPKVLKADL